MSKEVIKATAVKDKITQALSMLCDPVKQTLTPAGGNVLFTDSQGKESYSNDGVTIAKAISSDDNVEQLVIDVVRQAALRTNAMVGDGTTTTLLLSQSAIKEGLKLLENGWNAMDLKRELEKASKLMKPLLEKFSTKIRNKKDLEYVARVASNNDLGIAKDVVDVINTVGIDGQVVIEETQSNKTEIKKESGFFIDSGMFSPLLRNVRDKMEANYKNVKVLVTDKRIYYPSEAVAILDAVHAKGIGEIVIIARDFIGQAPNTFIANHTQGKMQILLIKDPDATETNMDSLEDIAAYLGTKVITDKAGQKTFNVKLEDFGIAEKVVANQDRTVFYGKSRNVLRLIQLRTQMKETKSEKEKDQLQKRIARMTRGAVTIFVGGSTPAEVRERVFRYEDAVNATRSALDSGFVVGGGMSHYLGYKRILRDPTFKKTIHADVKEMLRRVAEAPLQQVAINCNLHLPQLLEKVDEGLGYNAVTGKFADLLKDGIIEPTEVLTLSFEHALSVAQIILSSRYFIVDKHVKENSKKEN